MKHLLRKSTNGICTDVRFSFFLQNIEEFSKYFILVFLEINEDIIPLRGLSMLILLARMQLLCFKNKTKIIPIPSELSLVTRMQLIKIRYDDVIVFL
jgi:hypothetical protein